MCSELCVSAVARAGIEIEGVRAGKGKSTSLGARPATTGHKGKEIQQNEQGKVEKENKRTAHMTQRRKDVERTTIRSGLSP